MTLTFRDSVTARLYCAAAFAGGILIFGPALLLMLIPQDLGLYLDKYSVESSLMGLVLLITSLALALHFDWLGIQRMSRERSLSVSCIDFEPEYLRLTGHKGWQFHYARQGMSLSKDALAGKNGRTSYYLIIRVVEEKQEGTFFIGYDEKKVDDILATFTATSGSMRPGKTSMATLWEDYFPLSAYHVAALFFGVFVVFFDVLCLNGFSNPDHKDAGVWLALAILATTGFIWLMIKHLTRATGIWIAETCLRVRHAHGKTVEYPYACHVFDKKWITGKGQSTFRLQVWKNGKCIKKFGLGFDEDGVMLEMVFRKLTTARQEALKASPHGEC